MRRPAHRLPSSGAGVPPAPPRSSAAPLAWAWMALIAYASLYPFAGWTWPPGAQLAQLLPLRWPRYFIPFDIISNLLAYAPLGLLWTLMRLRHGARAGPALLAALVLGGALSWLMELAQQLLPQRVPSLLDWLLNTLGSLLGALLALAASALGLVRRWDRLRTRWLDRGQGGALALLWLWPPALLFPAPALLGLGQIGPVLRRTLADALSGVRWPGTLLSGVEPAVAAATAQATSVSLSQDAWLAGLGLLAPCLLAYSASRPGLHRLWLALGALLLGLGMATLSAVLSFGPAHALAWYGPLRAQALLLALLLAALAWRLPRWPAALLALLTLLAQVTLVHQAPADPYLDYNLQTWEQGQFMRLHGLAQWLGWLWPYAAMAWLLQRLRRPPLPTMPTP